jgi:DMSO/TMAO reductase YedYZ heme-binding membrane subunit
MQKYQMIILGLLLVSVLPFLALFFTVDFSLFSSNQEFFWADLLSTSASVSGLVGTILLFWQFILGIRVIVRYVTPDYAWINRLHLWLGKYGVIVVFMHPILTSLSYNTNLFLLFDLSSRFGIYLTIGRTALILLTAVWLTSAIFRKRLAFKPWKYVHYLSYPALFFALIHASEIGTYLNSYTPLQTIWYMLYALCIGAVIFRLLYHFKVIQFAKSKT